MIVRQFDAVVQSARTVHTDTWSSFRLITRDDGMGFSLHETWMYPGSQTRMWYKHHLEAVYCIEGEGEINVLDGLSGEQVVETHQIVPGMLYALDQHDRHIVRARTRLRLICVFTPPLRGDETHDTEGAYPAY
jgi:L-ectoine synthase